MIKFEIWKKYEITTNEFGEEVEKVFLLPADEIEEKEEGIKVYEYFDGSNLKEIINDSEYSLPATELTVTKDYVSLDEWDGHNLTTGGVGEHQEIHKVIEIDGETPDEPLYLINKWSQWQGEIPSGEVVDEYVLKEHLERLERDADEYIKEIKKL